LNLNISEKTTGVKKEIKTDRITFNKNESNLIKKKKIKLDIDDNIARISKLYNLILTL
jgi:hypothetical protein